ncbi:MAG: hypothetical protein AAFX99_10005 [Myxococcota bacterium]
MAERHSGTIVRLYADDAGTVLVHMMKQGQGTSLFTFELPRADPDKDLEVLLDLLKLALVHALPTVITEHNRQITHVELNRFA